MDWSYIAGYFDGEGNVRFKAAPSRPEYKLIGLTWSNTHLGSLEAMQAFMECGTIGHRRVEQQYKQGHQLKVERVEDILRVGESMIPFLIVKHDEVVAMLAWAKNHRQPQSERWGILTRIGAEEIARLYHEEGLTQSQIGAKYGVSGGSVSSFFLRNNIKGRRRGPKTGAYGILAQYGTEKIVAMFTGGMTIDEIAQEVGVQPHTIYMHLYHKGIRLSITKAIRRARLERKQQSVIDQEHIVAHIERQEMIQQLSLLEIEKNDGDEERL